MPTTGIVSARTRLPTALRQLWLAYSWQEAPRLPKWPHCPAKQARRSRLEDGRETADSPVRRTVRLAVFAAPRILPFPRVCGGNCKPSDDGPVVDATVT